MNALSLYSVSAELSAILNQLEEGGGELTPELEQALAVTEERFAAKAEDYGHAILNLRAMVAAIKAERDRLDGLRKHYERVEQRLTAAIAGAMKALDHEKVDTPTVRLSLRHTQSTEVDDLDKLDKRFVTVKLEQVADKTAIKNAILAGEDVAGAHINDNINLIIK